jgi:hypothetical protein
MSLVILCENTASQADNIQVHHANFITQSNV